MNPRPESTRLSNSYRQLSAPSSSITSGSCVSGDDDESSILLAISTLFQEDGCDSGDLPPEEGAVQTNKIVARVIPRDQIEYERLKPVDRLCDAGLLRQKLNEESDGMDHFLVTHEKARELNRAEINPSSRKMVAVLKVDAIIPSWHTPSIRYRIQMNMHRDANEPAQKTLHRLSLTLLRKFRQEERKIRHQEYHNNKTFFSQLGLEKRQQDIDATTSIWTQQCGGDLIGSGKVDEAEVEPEGYNRFLLTDDISTAKLWDTLSTSNSSKVCIDFLDENCESSASTVCLPVLACPPTILSVRTFENFGANVFVGVPLVVNVEIAHATRAVVTWFLDRTAVCHDAYVYTPRIDDIGKTLALLIVPVRPGHTGENGEGSEAYQFLKKVEELPSMPLVSPLRDAWLGDNLPRQHLRVMTYNLLADTYASRVMDQTVMYNHCPVKYLSMQRRMPMLLFELLSFQPDIICLQEVDREAYKSLFEPVFESQGYQGFYSNKACIQQQEGCAMFWSLRTFQRDSLVYQYYLKDLFQEQKNHHPEGWDSHHGIDRLLHENGELNLIATKKVGQVLQLAELRLLSPGDNKPDRVLVGNTHLFYHPLADHVRTLQAYTVCCQMDIVRRRNGRPCPLIFCGDLNSGPLSGAVQLLVLRSVGPDNHETWKHLRDYEWTMGGEDYLLEHEYIGNNVATGDLLYQVEAFEDAVQIFSDDDANEEPERTKESHTPPFIQLPSTFPRLISGFPNLPEFTNYAIDFSETLDYILVSEPSLSEPFGLLPYRAAPMPTSDFVRQYVAMPNEHMPSDHVSLICDLEWEHYDLRSLSPHARDRSRRLDEMENL